MKYINSRIMESMKNLFILVGSKLNLLRKYLLTVSSTLLMGLVLASCSSPLKYENRSNGSSYSQNSSSNQRAQCVPYYTVISGDTLSGIAKKCRVNMRSLAKQNDIRPPYFIYAKQELSMPTTVTPIQQAKSGSQSAADSSVVALSSTQYRKTVHSSGSKLKSKSSQWQWPMNSKPKHRFIRDSSGLSVLEIYGAPGQEVNTVAPGKVVYAGNGIVNYGWMIVIKHDDDYMSIYAHNSALLVKEGDRVERGQQIATLGATGNTTQSKIYLEARYQGRKIDILKVLKR